MQVTTPNRAAPAVLTMSAALLGLFIALLDITVVNVALPTIRVNLDASLSGLEWIANAYLLAVAAFIVTAGRIGDRIGQRRVYVAGIVFFLLGSLICAGAGKISVSGVSAISQLHVGRVVQGLGASIILPLSLAILYSGFDGKLRRVAIMLWGAVGGLATATGPLVGGLLVDHVGWQSIFLINIPVGLIVILAAIRGVANVRLARLSFATLDAPGLLTIGLALAALSLSLIDGNGWGWTSDRTIATFMLSIAAFLGFIINERAAREPIVDFAWFRRPSFGASVILGLLLGASVFSMIFYVSIYFQTSLGLSPEATGLRLLPLTVLIMVGAPLGGRIEAMFGTRTAVTIGYTLLAAGLGLFSLAANDGVAGSWTTSLPAMLLCGLALGMVMPIVSELTIASGPPDQVGMAASIGSMFRQIGNAIGVAIMGALLSTELTSAAQAATRPRATAAQLAREAVATAVHHMAWYGAAVSVIAAILALGWIGRKAVYRGRHRRQTAAMARRGGQHASQRQALPVGPWHRDHERDEAPHRQQILEEAVR